MIAQPDAEGPPSPKIDMESRSGPAIEASSLIRSPSPLPFGVSTLVGSTPLRAKLRWGLSSNGDGTGPYNMVQIMAGPFAIFHHVVTSSCLEARRTKYIQGSYVWV